MRPPFFISLVLDALHRAGVHLVRDRVAARRQTDMSVLRMRDRERLLRLHQRPEEGAAIAPLRKRGPVIDEHRELISGGDVAATLRVAEGQLPGLSGAAMPVIGL